MDTRLRRMAWRPSCWKVPGSRHTASTKVTTHQRPPRAGVRSSKHTCTISRQSQPRPKWKPCWNLKGRCRTCSARRV